MRHDPSQPQPWEETFRETAREREDWSDLDVALADGLDPKTGFPLKLQRGVARLQLEIGKCLPRTKGSVRGGQNRGTLPGSKAVTSV